MSRGMTNGLAGRLLHPLGARAQHRNLDRRQLKLSYRVAAGAGARRIGIRQGVDETAAVRVGIAVDEEDVALAGEAEAAPAAAIRKTPNRCTRPGPVARFRSARRATRREKKMEKMRAAVVRRFGQPLEIEERRIPRPGPGQILVQVHARAFATPISTPRRARARAPTLPRRSTAYSGGSRRTMSTAGSYSAF